MKILIVGLTKLKYMPYLRFYYDSLDHINDRIHICYWNRDENGEDLSFYHSAHLHEFVSRQQNSVKKITKVLSFLRYRHFIRKLMNKEKFDFVIFLHSLTGILIGNLLKSNQYIFDYRDSTFEYNCFFKKKIGTLVNNSYATFVSSRGFLQHLPISEKITISHNLLTESLNYRNFKKEESSKIRIVFWGYVRHIKINTTIIEKISNDDRFELHYFGVEHRDALRIKNFATNIGAKNVFFHGEYNPRQRYDFVKITDLIHNFYDDANTKIAVGNKYYDGIIFRTPQLCLTGSFMGKMISINGLGFECSPYDDDFLNQVYQYYQNLNFTKFVSNCDRELDNIITEYRKGQELIRNIGKIS